MSHPSTVLARHHAAHRRRHPHDDLLVLFDIDGALPAEGILGQMAWLQRRPRTEVGLITGRPEADRKETLLAFNALGAEHGVSLRGELLYMNRHGQGPEAEAAARADALCYYMSRGRRVVAVVGSGPRDRESMAEVDLRGRIRFLSGFAAMALAPRRVPAPL